MKSPPADTFTERMLRRSSGMSLLRRSKVLEAIEEDLRPTPRRTPQSNDGSSCISSSTGANELESQIAALEIINGDRERVEIGGGREINLATRVTDDDTEDILESPRAKRRCFRPDMESTRISVITRSPGGMTGQLVQVERTIPAIPAGRERGEGKIPYEVERFLEDALGDELNTTDRSNSHFNASELISEGRTPFLRRIMRFWNHKRSDNSSNGADPSRGASDNSTLNRSVRLYRTFSQRIKQKIRAALIRDKSPEVSPPEPARQPSFDKDRMDTMEHILKHMKIQQCTIEQASKALNVCRTSKEFIGSSEEVESERLLLIAGIRKRLLQEELKKLSNPSEEICHVKEPSDLTEWAEVTIENINLPLRECLTRESQSGEPGEWFVVVIIEGTNVWGSSPVPRPVGSMLLEFSNFLCTIDNLQPNFRITIEVYSLNLKCGPISSDEDKTHTLNSTLNRTWTYLSPSKFMRRGEKSPRVKLDQKVRSSSFSKCGYLGLSLHDLTLSSPWTLTAVPHDSILRGIVDLNLSCKLHLSTCHQGFLNFGERAGDFIVWNRRWCVLKGYTLMFWNYPREQECKPPVKTIDLMQCCSERIGQVDREICSKSRTILVETMRLREPGDGEGVLMVCRQGHTVQRFLLSFDNKKDVNEWTLKLNNVITALRDWNVKLMKNIQKSPMIPALKT